MLLATAKDCEQTSVPASAGDPASGSLCKPRGVDPPGGGSIFNLRRSVLHSLPQCTRSRFLRLLATTCFLGLTGAILVGGTWVLPWRLVSLGNRRLSHTHSGRMFFPGRHAHALVSVGYVSRGDTLGSKDVCVFLSHQIVPIEGAPTHSATNTVPTGVPCQCGIRCALQFLGPLYAK